MPGPTRKPEALAELEGNPGKRPYGDTPKPKAGAPKPPHFLKGEAMAEWGRVVPELDAIGLLSVVDRAAMTAYCQSWATFVAATEDINERGVMVEGRDDTLVKNPSVQLQRDALANIKIWCTEFGLTPSARARMRLPSEGGESNSGEAAVLELFA